MLRILLADDHEVMRRGLRHLVEEQPGWELCGEAATGREAVELAKEKEPDIAILDVSMPELLAEGLRNKTISAMLAISVKTVETHRAAIMRKIGARSVVDVVRYAVRNKIAEA